MPFQVQLLSEAGDGRQAGMREVEAGLMGLAGLVQQAKGAGEAMVDNKKRSAKSKDVSGGNRAGMGGGEAMVVASGPLLQGLAEQLKSECLVFLNLMVFLRLVPWLCFALLVHFGVDFWVSVCCCLLFCTGLLASGNLLIRECLYPPNNM